MNILYINHYAGSPEMGMEFRPYYLSREWSKLGYNVRIIAGDYSHLRQKNPTVDADFKEDNIDGITYNWVKTGKDDGNGIRRALSMIRFVGKLRRRASWIAQNWEPDVIITSSTYPIDTFAGQKIKKCTNGKALLIHEVHDMWPITLIEIGKMKKYNPFVVLMQIGENSFCKNSDYVVSLLCEAKDYFMNHGMKPEKFKTVLNGIVLDEWNNPTDLPDEHNRLLHDLHEQNKFVICFFGSVNVSYAIDYLIKAKELCNNDKVAIVIIGEGNQKEELKRIAGKDVYFLPRIPKTSIPLLMNSIDCCYVGALHNDMFRFGICMNKLFDSMMSGKPILYAVDAPNNFIKDYECGISVEPENAEALAEGIKILMACSDEQRAVMGSNGRKAVIEHYTYEKLAKQFIEIIEGRN